jgi:hypothetical protein
MATALLGAGPWTAAHAQPAAVVVLVDNPWKLVAKGTLQAAVVAAEKFSGGRVLEIRFRTFHGAPGFDAVVAKAGAFSHVRIAIPSDVVTVIAETEVPEWMAAWTLKADARSLQQAKLHLVDAITKAETITDAPAVDAGVAAPLTGRSAVLAYNVEVIKRDRPERVAIDAQTGDAIANPEALLETWTPEKALYESLKKAPAG